jgi:hypothetical protein
MGNMIDWSTEYDIFDPQYIADPFTIWDQLRGTCPVAHTDKYQGSWLPTTYETVTEMARSPHPSASTRRCTPTPAARCCRRSRRAPSTS